MIQGRSEQTLREFIAEREKLNDMKDGFKLIDAPHLDLWILKWN